MKGRDDKDAASDPQRSGEQPASGAGRAPFAPPVSDRGVVAILKGLHPALTPEPMQISTTDGDMSARYSGGAQTPPTPGATPLPEPAVVLDRRPPLDADGSRERITTTFRLRPGSSSLRGPAWAAALFVAVVTVAWVARIALSRDTGTPPPPPPSAVAPRPAPSPPRVTPQPTAASPAASSEPAPAATPVQSASPAPSSSAPRKPTPSRPRKDEPERSL